MWERVTPLASRGGGSRDRGGHAAELGGSLAGRGARGGHGGVGVAGQRRVVTDLGDVIDAGPAQPVAEVGGLEVAAELRAELRSPDGARVDDGGALAAAGEQMLVA